MLVEHTEKLTAIIEHIWQYGEMHPSQRCTEERQPSSDQNL